VRTFADPSFFRLFHALLEESCPDRRQTQWSRRGVAWVHQRHSFTGIACGFGIHQYTMTKSGPQGWSLLVVKEHWWAVGGETSLRATEWAKPLTGKRTHIIDWLRAEERRIAAASTEGRTADDRDAPPRPG